MRACRRSCWARCCCWPPWSQWAPPRRLSFAGDMIVVLYVAAMSCGPDHVERAYASASPYASIGSSREMMMLLSVEPILAIALSWVRSRPRTLALGGIASLAGAEWTEHQHGDRGRGILPCAPGRGQANCHSTLRRPTRRLWAALWWSKAARAWRCSAGRCGPSSSCSLSCWWRCSFLGRTLETYLVDLLATAVKVLVVLVLVTVIDVVNPRGCASIRPWVISCASGFRHCLPWPLR